MGRIGLQFAKIGPITTWASYVFREPNYLFCLMVEDKHNDCRCVSVTGAFYSCFLRRPSNSFHFAPGTELELPPPCSHRAAVEGR